MYDFMRKLTVTTLIAGMGLVIPATARAQDWERWHHHHHRRGISTGEALLGAGLIAGLFSHHHERRDPPPVVVTPAVTEVPPAYETYQKSAKHLRRAAAGYRDLAEKNRRDARRYENPENQRAALRAAADYEAQAQELERIADQDDQRALSYAY